MPFVSAISDLAVRTSTAEREEITSKREAAIEEGSAMETISLGRRREEEEHQAANETRTNDSTPP
jgi:hypothetical protein